MKSLRTIIIIISLLVVVVLLVLAPRFKRAAERTAALEMLPAEFSTDTLVTLGNDEHMRGSENPIVTIVEYSDLDCPFCHKAQPIVDRVVRNNTDVALVYRQLPLEGLHPDALNKARITECLAQGENGSTNFWLAVDGYMKQTPTSAILADLGVTLDSLKECMESKATADAIAADMKSAEKIGVQGTPYFVVIGPNGEQFAIPGMPQGMLLDVAVEKMLAAKK